MKFHFHKIFSFSLILLAPLALADTTLEIDLAHPGATINKNVYGQFMEHLGRGIYEGIWVGEDSEIPNTRGYRNDVLQALRELQVPLLRWPGGCFADEYHWRDGIGPREQRPRRVNTTWGGVIEPNSFGTHEFMELTELLGADAYVNGNLGTGTPAEMAQWLEYMTSDSDSSLANLRRANGRDKPWRVHFFAIGNESWGCGGSMTPQYYGDLYKHYATFLKTPADNTPVLIASGGTDDETNWVEYLAGEMQPVWSYRLQAISHHHYSLPTGNWDKKGEALGFGEEEWISTFVRTLEMEDYIRNNLALLDKYDPEQSIGFYVDEWGTWYDVSQGNPGFLYQQNSLRDAVVAALNLNIFHKYAQRIQMTNIAQMVNVLQAMILTDGEKMLLTPTYHVFRMYIPFQGATYVPLQIKGAGEYRFNGESVPKISASSALGKDGKLYVAVTNTDPHNSETITLATGSSLASAQGWLLTDEKMDAHNTFEHPAALQPQQVSIEASAGRLQFELPAKSVTVLRVE